MIYMLWRECMPIEFYKFICEEKNFLYLNGKNILQPKVLQIIAEFIEADEKNYRLLQNNLSSYKNIFQNIFILTFIQKFNAQRKNEVLTLRAIFT